MVKGRSGANRSVISTNIDGNDLHASVEYIANARDLSCYGQFMGASGYSVSGIYIELTAGIDRRQIQIQNSGTANLFIGPSGNGVSNMIMVGSGEKMTICATSGIKIYGITENNIANVKVFELG